jgi:hypothetical protein
MNEQEIIKTQQELIDLLYSQVVDLSMIRLNWVMM